MRTVYDADLVWTDFADCVAVYRDYGCGLDGDLQVCDAVKDLGSGLAVKVAGGFCQQSVVVVTTPVLVR